MLGSLGNIQYNKDMWRWGGKGVVVNRIFIFNICISNFSLEFRKVGKN